MKVRVRLFALAKERAGRPEVEVGLTPPATVGDLRERPASVHPQLGPLCAGAMIAVDEEYASDETPVSPASRIALIPPVSGGGEGFDGPRDRRKRAVPSRKSRPAMIEITESPIDHQAVTEQVRSNRGGSGLHVPGHGPRADRLPTDGRSLL